MNKIFNIKTCMSVAMIAGVLTFGSCEDFIDIEEYVYDKMTIDSVFISKERTLQYINGTAEYLLDESKLVTGASYPSGLATDEAFAPWVDWNHRAMYLTVDQVTPRDTKGFNPWGTFYRGIRKANI
ncbi:MAG: RagB/SusD family nutrient uptake outer membrane protein, partial [Tannerella sp.]|nr:RagB/SusD family nutrient uptake outer membrane protein [Tannerella sp.]